MNISDWICDFGRGTKGARTKMMLIAGIALVMLSFIPFAYGASPSVELACVTADSVQADVKFPVAKSDVDPSFADNRAQLSAFTKRLVEASSSSSLRIKRLSIVGYASPEGSYDLNQRLSHQRADNLVNYFRSKCEIPDSVIEIRYAGIDWAGLDRALDESGLDCAPRVQYIIRNEPEFTYNAKGKLVRSRKQQLMNLDGGRIWNRMLRDVYPGLRRSTSVSCFIEEVRERPDLTGNTLAQDTVVPVYLEPDDNYASDFSGYSESLSQSQNVAEDLPRYPVVAFRSNLLLPLLNVGMEVPVHKHWSVGLDYYYPWAWPVQNNRNCFELIFVSAEARYWFNPKGDSRLPNKNFLTGHSLALYAAAGYYDFERNYHGHQGEGISVGVDYTYALPVANNKLRIEFQIAVGGVWSPKARPYNVYEWGGHLIREKGHNKNFSYFGPTKVGISLVWPIFRKVKPSTSPAL